MDFFLELISEFFFQAIFEIFVAALDGTFDLSGRGSRVLLKTALYALLGIGTGYVSFLLIPTTLTGLPPNAVLSFVVLPLAVGIVGVAFSRWGEKRRDWELAGSGFSYSFLLAFSFSATRYLLINPR